MGDGYQMYNYNLPSNPNVVGQDGYHMYSYNLPTIPNPHYDKTNTGLDSNDRKNVLEKAPCPSNQQESMLETVANPHNGTHDKVKVSDSGNDLGVTEVNV